MYMCVCVCVCVCVCMHEYIMCTYLCILILIYIHIHTYMHTYILTHIYTYVHVEAKKKKLLEKQKQAEEKQRIEEDEKIRIANSIKKVSPLAHSRLYRAQTRNIREKKRYECEHKESISGNRSGVVAGNRLYERGLWQQRDKELRIEALIEEERRSSIHLYL